MSLPFIADPGTKSQATASPTVAYYVYYPDLIGDSNSYGARVVKNPEGPGGFRLNFMYEVDGSPFRNVQQAQTACQNDWDKYGETVPEHKIPPPIVMPVMPEVPSHE